MFNPFCFPQVAHVFLVIFAKIHTLQLVLFLLCSFCGRCRGQHKNDLQRIIKMQKLVSLIGDRSPLDLPQDGVNALGRWLNSNTMGYISPRDSVINQKFTGLANPASGILRDNTNALNSWLCIDTTMHGLSRCSKASQKVLISYFKTSQSNTRLLRYGKTSQKRINVSNLVTTLKIQFDLWFYAQERPIPCPLLAMLTSSA